VFILHFSPTRSLVFGWKSITDRGGGLQVFQHLLVLKMSDEGASLGDPMGKSEYQSRSEKRRREL
jgi:hypothetical protein